MHPLSLHTALQASHRLPRVTTPMRFAAASNTKPAGQNPNLPIVKGRIGQMWETYQANGGYAYYIKVTYDPQDAFTYGFKPTQKHKVSRHTWYAYTAGDAVTAVLVPKKTLAEKILGLLGVALPDKRPSGYHLILNEFDLLERRG